MKIKMTLFLLSFLASSFALASEGVLSKQSKYTVAETADRFEAIIKKKGLTLFTRINHAINAAKVDLELRPTETILFGNPKIGTPLMNCAQMVAIDLPQKALIWQDEAGKVWFSYNDPQHLKKRHNIEGCDKVINKISGALSKLSDAVIK